MTTEELIEYIYSTELEKISFNDDLDKGKRMLILLYHFGIDRQKEIEKQFGDKISLNNITPQWQ